MSALLFGSLSTVADTSEQQRDAFNQAFARHGLDWHWGPEQYRSMLTASGGEQRIADYARGHRDLVDAKAVHQTKSEIFQAGLASSKVQARDGVVDTIRAAQQAGTKVAFVTTTSAENVSALLTGLNPTLSRLDFDLVVDASTVQHGKPDRAAYSYALEALREQAGHCLAIEDNLDGVASAVAAGLRCIAFPNANTATQHFPAAQQRVDRLDFPNLRELLSG